MAKEILESKPEGRMRERKAGKCSESCVIVESKAMRANANNEGRTSVVKETEFLVVCGATK